VHEHRFDKLALQTGSQRTALNRVLVHIQDPTRSPNAGTFGQGFAHSQEIFLTQPHVPQCRSTPAGIAAPATGAVKQGDMALPIPGGGSTGVDGGFGSLTVMAAGAFFDERSVESKQARHPLMTEMGHEHFGLPIEMNGCTAISKEGLIVSADEP